MDMRLKKKPRRRSKSLYPVLYVIGSLKDYHQELVQSEVSSLHQLSMVRKLKCYTKVVTGVANEI